MNILVLHNYYQQPGGEDQVFADEVAMLRAHGHAVTTHTVHNDRIDAMSRLRAARATIWNGQSYRDIAKLVRENALAVVHCHNTFPLLSPSVYHAARQAGAAVVQTLHNYRFTCAAATCFRDGHVCTDCVGKTFPGPALLHRCYHGSLAATGAVVAMQTYHRVSGTYQRSVDRYIALTPFARELFVRAGLPAHKLVVKPNMVDPDPGAGAGDGGFALFVGRLVPEKGIATLLEAWKKSDELPPLNIVGDGPLSDMARDASAANPRVTWLGRQPAARVMELMGRAAVCIFPSTWYEGLPKTILEAYAVGTPVIAGDLGSMAALVQPGRTGLLFEAGNAAALAASVRNLMEDGARLAEMRLHARQAFLERYTAKTNYAQLIDIYAQAIQERQANARN